MIRPRINGPRSFILTITLLPFLRLVTRTFVPNRKLRWAAVMAAGFMRSPEAVFEVSAYQDAPPHWAFAWNGVASIIVNDTMAKDIPWPDFRIDLRDLIMLCCPL